MLFLQYAYFLEMSPWETGHLKLDLEGKGTGFCWMLSSISIRGEVSYQVKSPGDAMQVSTVMQQYRKNQVLKGSSRGKEGGQGRRLWEQGRWHKQRGRN